MRTLILTISILTLTTAPAADKISFNEHIRPILSDRCFHCHGPDAENQKSELRLDSFHQATADLGGYAAIVPGDLKASELHARIHSTDKVDQMPPPDSNRSLSDKERALLDQWIKEGAPYDTHWSFKPIPDKIHPPTNDAPNPIDRFIEQKFQSKNLQPAATVSPEKWLRRATFDLTGLPPTLEEIDTFLANPTDRAATIDRLMNTDAFAERMTSEWLDVARYADSYGYQVDKDRFVWPWRDWVIRAFRNNMPYNQFITEQLAGDLLPNPTRDQILATTFNRLHPQKVEGGSVPEEFRIEYISDRTHTAGTAFLGLTFECARCHDHKYDPLTQKEYYEMSAFFANIDEAGLYAYFTRAIPTPTLDLPTPQQESALKQAAEKESAALTAYQNTLAKTTPPNHQITAPKPLAHLTLDNRKGNNFDYITKPTNETKPATTNGNNKSIPGKKGQALHLTGDDVLKLEGIANFPRSQPFSLALWIQTPDHKERAVIARRSKAWTDAASRGYELMIEDGKLTASLIHFFPGDAIKIESEQKLPLKSWHHITLTYDGSSKAAGLNLYLNGEPLPTTILHDNLTREITGGGDPFLAFGERMRDKGFKNGVIDDIHIFDRELSTASIKKLVKPETTTFTNPERLDHYNRTANPAAQKALTALQQARAARHKIKDPIPHIMVMAETETPVPTHLLNRGMYNEKRDQLSANTPATLPPFDKALPKNRLGLAHWLTDPSHPLTARVTVNRYWQMLFGNGLVKTSEDFGLQGESPTHPELLDWLARDFINHGWDLRHLLKQMLLSATYAQSTTTDPATREADPENKLLARFPTRRLTAEMIRDNALATSGLLVNKVGGNPVKPYDLKVSFKPMNHHTGENLYRRSLYTYWKRTAPAPVMMTMNASKRDVCRVKREITHSPLQALVMMNDPQIIEAARIFAESIQTEDPASRITTAFRKLTSRTPTNKEKAVLTKLYQDQLSDFQANPKNATELLKTGQKKANQKLSAPDVAATTILINAIMNLDESLILR